MELENRKFNWDFNELKRFYNNYIVKWINSTVNWTEAQMKQARANLGFGNGDIDDEPTDGSDNLVKSGGVAATSGYYINYPEFVDIKLDAEGKILFGIQQDGNVLFGAGVPRQVADYIQQKIDELSLDEYEDIVVFLDNIWENDKTLQELLDEKLDAEGLDPDALSSQSTITSPEYLQVTTDREGKVLQSRNPEGVNKEYVGIETPKVSIDGATIENIQDPEGRTEIKTDSKGRIISYRDINGMLHEEAGIKTSSISTDKLNIFKLSKGTYKYSDIAIFGVEFYIRLSNFSEYACELPIDFCDEHGKYISDASTYFRTTSNYLPWNKKYGRAYLKSGEDITIKILNTVNAKSLRIDTSNINCDTEIEIKIMSGWYGNFVERNMSVIPCLGSGKMYVQPKNINYCHCSKIFNIGKYLLVYFDAAQFDSRADRNDYPYGHFMTLAVIEKGNYNNTVYKTIDGNPSRSSLYENANQNCYMCPKDDKLYIHYYAYNTLGEDVPVFYTKVFDTLTFQFTEPAQCYLTYNDNTVPYNKRNELEMLNTLYGYDFDLDNEGASLSEICDMRYYNGLFYRILGGNSRGEEGYPWALLKSTDCITWEPVANIVSDKTAELSWDICNDIILVHIRDGFRYNSSRYMVCDIDGNVLKAPTQLSDVDSKGAVFVKRDVLYMAYNISGSGNNNYYRRNKICIARLNTNNYTLETLKTFSDMNGFQYFDFDCKDDVVYMSNTEDPRGYNYGEIGPYGGCSIAVVNEDVFSNN